MKPHRCGPRRRAPFPLPWQNVIPMCRVFGSILLMGLHVEMVQYAVEDRSQHEAGCDDKQKTREDRVGSCKIFPAVVFSSPIGPMPARIIAALTYESASDMPSNAE